MMEESTAKEKLRAASSNRTAGPRGERKRGRVTRVMVALVAQRTAPTDYPRKLRRTRDAELYRITIYYPHGHCSHR